jgi:hypothetical protein
VTLHPPSPMSPSALTSKRSMPSATTTNAFYSLRRCKQARNCRRRTFYSCKRIRIRTRDALPTQICRCCICRLSLQGNEAGATDRSPADLRDRQSRLSCQRPSRPFTPSTLALPSHEHLLVLLLRRDHRTAINGRMHILNSCTANFLSGVYITPRSSYVSRAYSEWRGPFSHCSRHSRSYPCRPILFRDHAALFFWSNEEVEGHKCSPLRFGSISEWSNRAGRKETRENSTSTQVTISNAIRLE